MRAFLIAVVAVAVAAVVLLILRAPPGEEDLSTLEEVVQHIESSYINKDEVDANELEAAAIRGIIEALDDPYSAYASPAEAEISFNFSGEFEGIGAEIGVRDGQLLILQPLPGSPAERAGLMPGDAVLEVDGESVEGLSTLEVVSRVRGPKDTEVVLTVLRAGLPEPLDVTVVRDTIVIASVEGRLLDEDPRVGYVALSRFEGRSHSDMQDALATLRDGGAQVLVLDLRNNAGGLVDAAVAIASEFLDGGVVVTLVDSDGNRTEFMATEGGTATDLPLAVLVNGFSASASEILTGAFQDRERAVIVGSPTFGKGSVNTAFDLRNEGGLFLTTGRWLTPGGQLIEGDGLEPDVFAGPPIDRQALASISRQLQELCAEKEKEEVRNVLVFAPDALDALDNLCSIEPRDVPEPTTDEALAEAVRLLQLELGG